jgi:Fic family protein
MPYHWAMIFATPVLGGAELAAVARIGELRDALAHQIAVPRRWYGSLRRLTIARAVQASNSIEGIDATIEDVLAAADGQSPLDAADDTYEAVRGYQAAMTFVLQLSRSEPLPPIDLATIRSLHFMITGHDLSKNPGRWRPGAVWVERGADGAVVYEGPPADLVTDLLDELVDHLATDESPVLVRAAMAHLNLVMIHPFSDGNGRMARCIQTLVLARERIVEPEFSSIEEHLGRNTAGYYGVLSEVGRGAWHPERDARPWLRFCLDAHEDQARRVLQRLHDTERLWEQCAALAAHHRLSDRTIPALVDAARGQRLRNATYRRLVERSDGEAITETTASRDLRSMVEAGLLAPRGEKRGRVYVGIGPLRGRCVRSGHRGPDQTARSRRRGVGVQRRVGAVTSAANHSGAAGRPSAGGAHSVVLPMGGTGAT